MHTHTRALMHTQASYIHTNLDTLQHNAAVKLVSDGQRPIGGCACVYVRGCTTPVFIRAQLHAHTHVHPHPHPHHPRELKSKNVMKKPWALQEADLGCWGRCGEWTGEETVSKKQCGDKSCHTHW